MKRFPLLGIGLMMLMFTLGCAGGQGRLAQEPEPLVFEWPVSEPEAQGMDAELLAQIPTFVADTVPQVESVLVIRNGEIVYEAYFGRTADTVDHVWSVTKSVTSALIGIAIDDGLIDSVDQPLTDFFSADQLVNSDPLLATVTLRDLLTMTSGIACPGDSCHGASLADSLGRELTGEPGDGFVYDTGASHLLAGVLESATGMGVQAYADAKLFAPLQFDAYEWDSDSGGTPFGGKGLQLNARDMAKLGQLFLDGGVWMGDAVISAEYVTESISPQVDLGEGADYGYLWWLAETVGYDSYAAVGYGGQYVHVVPELDLVTVLASSYIPARDNSVELIDALIVPAVLDVNE